MMLCNFTMYREPTNCPSELSLNLRSYSLRSDSTRFCSELHSTIQTSGKKNEAKFTSSPCARPIDRKGSFSFDIVSRLAFYRRFPSAFLDAENDRFLFLFLPTFLHGRRVVYVTDATYRNSCTTLVLDSPSLFCTAKPCMYILCSWGQFSMAFVPSIKIRRTM